MLGTDGQASGAGSEMRAWDELLRMYVRDLLSHVVDAPRGGTHHRKQTR